MNEDLLVTVAQASVVFTRLRGNDVTRHTIHGWVSRYGIEVRDKRGNRGAARYRIGDLMDAEKRARNADLGIGKGRPLAA